MFKYPARTRRNSSVAKAKEVFERLLSQKSAVQKDNNLVWVAGRIVGTLEDGFVLQDESGRIEINNLRLKIKNCEIGDIVEINVSAEKILQADGKTGLVFFADELHILAFSRADFFIRKDDPNYRKAIIDLNLKDKLEQRQRLIRKIREFFWGRNFVEVETPSLVRLPGMEPYLDVFKTEFVSEDKKRREDMFLITSPEYAMKKLLVAGYEKIFQICKSFRNKETASELHNPEFTILEWYRAYASYKEIMCDMEELVYFLALEQGSSIVTFKGYKVDVTPPWPRLKVCDAFTRYAGIAREDFEDIGKFRNIVKKKGYKITAKTLYEDLFFMVFMNEIEPKLGLDKPVILCDYPVSMAALSKTCEDDLRYSERFEVYAAGLELCNAFTELNDPDEQLARLTKERTERQKLGKEDYSVDQSFIGALQCGMPPAGGTALGVDRLIMFLTNTPDINDILFFPHKDL